MINTWVRHRLSEIGSLFGIIHVTGSCISFIYFSYLYLKEHGFLAWLLFGEIMPLLKATVWEVFLVLALIQEEPSQPTELAHLTNSWWKSEYPSLVHVVRSAEGRSLSASYRTGPRGEAQAKVKISFDPNRGLIAYIEPPKQAFSSLDPNSGEKIPREREMVIIVRDHDLDGKPDDFSFEPPENGLQGAIHRRWVHHIQG